MRHLAKENTTNEPRPNLHVTEAILGTFTVEIRSCPACHGRGYFTILDVVNWHKLLTGTETCEECSGKGAILTARRCKL